MAGHTYSTDFPVKNACHGPNGESADTYVTKFDPSGSTLSYSTCLGGSAADFGYGIAVDCSGNAYVTGQTSSEDFPAKNACQGSYGGLTDAFVTRISAGNVLPGALMLLLLGD